MDQIRTERLLVVLAVLGALEDVKADVLETAAAVVEVSVLQVVLLALLLAQEAVKADVRQAALAVQVVLPPVAADALAVLAVLVVAVVDV